MYRNAAFFAFMVASHIMCLANPVPDPDPGHKTHVRIHVPYEVHTLHHHHIEKVPVYKEIPVIKEVPVIHKVPVIHTYPIVKTVPVPIVNTVAIEKPILVPVKEHYGFWH